MRHALLCALVLLAPPAFDDDPMPLDKAKIQGAWTITEVEEDGETIPAEALADQVLEFEGDKYFVKVSDEVVESGTFTIRPEKSPRELDLKIQKGDDAGKVQLGLYKFDGERLKLALARPGEKQRPTIFETKGEGAALLSSTLKKKSD